MRREQRRDNHDERAAAGVAPLAALIHQPLLLHVVLKCSVSMRDFGSDFVPVVVQALRVAQQQGAAAAGGSPTPSPFGKHKIEP